jgi:hypothetical protein
MAEPKPLASLTSGLLARKGAAQPAMRRPSLTGFDQAMPASFQDDLGWNDMGADSAPAQGRPLSGLTPMAPAPVAMPVPAVVAEQKALAGKVAAIVAPVPVAAGRKTAFTLRLDAERHLKLRLACAVQNRSAQQIVTDALDRFLSGLPEIDRLADQLPRDRGGPNKGWAGS